MKKWYQYRCEELGLGDITVSLFLAGVFKERILSRRLRQFLFHQLFREDSPEIIKAQEALNRMNNSYQIAKLYAAFTGSVCYPPDWPQALKYDLALREEW